MKFADGSEPIMPKSELVEEMQQAAKSCMRSGNDRRQTPCFTMIGRRKGDRRKVVSTLEQEMLLQPPEKEPDSIYSWQGQPLNHLSYEGLLEAATFMADWRYNQLAQSPAAQNGSIDILWAEFLKRTPNPD